MAIDLGNTPTGTPPTAGEKLQIRSAIGVGTTDAPTFLAQTLTGQSLTGTQATNLLDLATTWDTTGTPTGIKLDVTNTNSNVASKLLDLRVGGGSLFSVRKDGLVSAALRFSIGTAGMWETGMSVGASLSYSWSSTSTYTSTADLILARDAAGILAQRNGTSAQAFRVYNTYTDASNYERGTLLWTSNQLFIGTEILGTGAPRDVTVIASGATSNLNLRTGTANRWQINPSGHFLAASDNAYDIGASGAKPKNIYAASNIECGTTNSLGWTGRARMFSPSGSNNVIQLLNNAASDFNLLILGLATSAFPAIKRNGADINIALADDSGLAGLSCALFNAAGIVNAASSRILWSGRSAFSSPSDGVLRVTNNGSTGFTRLELGEADMGIMRGSGTPENIVTAKVGSIYLRTDGGSGSSFYVKESGSGANGWVGK